MIKDDTEVINLTNNISNTSTQNSVIQMDINKIQLNKSQPRKTFNDTAIDELAISINNVGIINPLIVIPKGNFYEIISGERRFRAARKLKLKKIPILIKSYDDLRALEVSLIDNIQRENLNPIEEALTYKKFQESFNLNQEQIANKVGKSRVTIANCLRLLKLDSKIQSLIIESKLSQGHARTLLSINNPKLQLEIAEKIINNDLSVRAVENLVKTVAENIKFNQTTISSCVNSSNNSSSGVNGVNITNINTDNLNIIKKLEHDKFYFNLSNELNEILGTKVTIKDSNYNRVSNTSNNKIKLTNNVKGKIEIEYYSQNDLDRIVCLFKQLQ
ncbi:MAG: ParB/RepB/Spo0J family partition protein [bacterium]